MFCFVYILTNVSQSVTHCRCTLKVLFYCLICYISIYGVSFIYQVQNIGVDEASITSNSLRIYWYIQSPPSFTSKFEFLPAISPAPPANEHWTNHSTWINETNFLFTNLQPYTKYNITVLSRVVGDRIVPPPAIYFITTTGEGSKY